MSTRVVPQQNVITCDLCLRQVEPHGPAKHKTRSTLNMDSNGEWAFEGWRMDLCDDCKTEVNLAIDALRKAKVKPNETLRDQPPPQGAA